MKKSTKEKEFVVNSKKEILSQRNASVSTVITRAKNEDLQALIDFLQSVDKLFTPPLSTREITIPQRVEKKMSSGLGWLIAKTGSIEAIKYNHAVITGCLAIVPCNLNKNIPVKTSRTPIAMGIDLNDWLKDVFFELSTMATSPLARKLGINGIGELLVTTAKKLIHEYKPDAGLITDSWVGGPMGSFIEHLINKELGGSKIDPLIKMFSDPEKRGIYGPPTTVYIVPTDQRDINYLKSKQFAISNLRKEYFEIENLLNKLFKI